MQFVSSDTNVWMDFFAIRQMRLPFRLPYIYIMNADAIADELISPPDIGERLILYGLVAVEITTEEFLLAQEYEARYRRLSKYDRTALAIAKARGIKLLTGDKALRRAAESECVETIGTIWILDQLLEQEKITKDEYILCLQGLAENNGGIVRLPIAEINLRLERFCSGQ